MYSRTTTLGLAGLLGAALLAAGCSEPVGPSRGALDAPRFAVTASGIALDQQNGTLNEKGTVLIKGFNTTSPHVGDAIVATFFWAGSTNIIDSVTDVLTTAPSYTPVGNTYALVDYVTAGGFSMATYVATNVQHFPDAYNNARQDSILAVRANLSQAVTDGGVLLSAYTGVNAVSALALGAHHSAVGSGSTATTADPGAIAVGAGALTYGVSMSGLYGMSGPAGYTLLQTMSDAALKADGEYTVTSAVGSADPQWTWYFNSPGAWLATVLALNPPLHFVFTGQPTTTLPLVAMQPPVRVAAVDALGNTVTSFTGSVTIAIGHNGGLLTPGTLSGTKTVTAVNGVATFSDLSIDQPGNGYTLVVAGAGVTGAESPAFNIGAL
jgi:hypothetical protein